jgi:hypothetical protein
VRARTQLLSVRSHSPIYLSNRRRTYRRRLRRQWDQADRRQSPVQGAWELTTAQSRLLRRRCPAVSWPAGKSPPNCCVNAMVQPRSILSTPCAFLTLAGWHADLVRLTRDPGPPRPRHLHRRQQCLAGASRRLFDDNAFAALRVVGSCSDCLLQASSALPNHKFVFQARTHQRTAPSLQTKTTTAANNRRPTATRAPPWIRALVTILKSPPRAPACPAATSSPPTLPPSPAPSSAAPRRELRSPTQRAGTTRSLARGRRA